MVHLIKHFHATQTCIIEQEKVLIYFNGICTHPQEVIQLVFYQTGYLVNSMH